jgi:hypothetical protein
MCSLGSLGAKLIIGSEPCPSLKMLCRDTSLSAKIVHSHVGHHSVCVSFRSTAGFGASSPRFRKSSLGENLSVSIGGLRIRENVPVASGPAIS